MKILKEVLAIAGSLFFVFTNKTDITMAKYFYTQGQVHIAINWLSDKTERGKVAEENGMPEVAMHFYSEEKKFSDAIRLALKLNDTSKFSELEKQLLDYSKNRKIGDSDFRIENLFLDADLLFHTAPQSAVKLAELAVQRFEAEDHYLNDYLLGVAERLLGADRSIKFAESITQKCDSRINRNLLGSLYEKNGNLAEASKNYVLAREWKKAAVCADKIGDKQEADELLEKYIKSKPGDMQDNALFALARFGITRAAQVFIDDHKFDEGVEFVIKNGGDEKSVVQIYDRGIAHFIQLGVISRAAEFESKKNVYEKYLAGNSPNKNNTARTSQSVINNLFCPECQHVTNTGAFCLSCGNDLWPSDDKGLISGRYKINKWLGSGAAGDVFLVLDNRFEGQVYCVMKTVSNSRNRGQKQKIYNPEWFEREAGLLAILKHPLFPRVTDKFIDANKGYIVMDYVEGKDLQTILEESEGGLSEKDVLDYAIQVCDGLSYLHSQDKPIVHRDIKPANIMVVNGGKRVVVVDFGIAQYFTDYQGLGSAPTKHTAAGTPGYTPPEQYCGFACKESDIYALGATMHHLLTAKDPSMTPFIFAPITTINPDISLDTERVLITATAYNAKERYTDALKMRVELEKIREKIK